MQKQSAIYSLGIHLALVTLLLLVAATAGYTHGNYRAVTSLEYRPPRQKLMAPPVHRLTAPGSEGGGHHDLPPVEWGRIPHPAQKVFMVPTVRPPRIPQIVLPSGQEDVPDIAADMPIGLPNGVLGTHAAGPGGPNGIGNGKGEKSGPGTSRGPGNERGPGGGDGSQARLSALPQVLWKIEPEYSEEARRARYQGSVMLALEVDSQGRPRNIRIVKSLGLGLDERAIQAVSHWRFKPGVRDGRAVNAPVSIEVSFRLL